MRLCDIPLVLLVVLALALISACHPPLQPDPPQLKDCVIVLRGGVWSKCPSGDGPTVTN